MCPWCQRVCTKAQMTEVALPDDDFIEVCDKCAVEHEIAKEAKHSAPRLKTPERTYAAAGYRR